MKWLEFASYIYSELMQNDNPKNQNDLHYVPEKLKQDVVVVKKIRNVFQIFDPNLRIEDELEFDNMQRDIIN